MLFDCLFRNKVTVPVEEPSDLYIKFTHERIESMNHPKTTRMHKYVLADHFTDMSDLKKAGFQVQFLQIDKNPQKYSSKWVQAHNDWHWSDDSRTQSNLKKLMEAMIKYKFPTAVGSMQVTGPLSNGVLTSTSKPVTWQTALGVQAVQGI